MRPASAAGLLLLLVSLAGPAASIAQDGRGVLGQLVERQSASASPLLIWLLIALAGVLAVLLAVTARRARDAASENGALRRQISELTEASETLSRLAAIVESSDDAIIGKSLDGAILSWNPGAERIYGYAKEEVIGQPVSLLVPPDRPDELTRILERIRRGERVDHFETVRRRRDGTLINVSLSVSPIKDAAGTVTGASTIARDITEKKRSEEAIRQSEERYRDLVEHSEDLIYTHDLEGRLLSVNRALIRRLGYEDPEELLGRKLSEFLASDVLYLFDAYLEVITKEGRARGVMKVLTRGGEERFFEYRNTLRSKGVAAPFVHGISHDVTDQVRAQTALERRSRRMQTLRAFTLEIARELDLTTLLGLITQRAAALLGAVSGAVYLWDEKAQVLSVPVSYSLGEWTRGKKLRLGEEIAGTVAQRRQGMIVNDYETSPYASSVFVERAGFTAVIAEPLLYHDQLVGVLAVNNEGSWQFFTEEDRDLLGLFAVEAAIAIENARLFSALGDSKRRLEELYELGLAMREHRMLAATLDLVLKGAKTVLGFDRMNILLADNDRKWLRAAASLGTEEPLDQIYVPVGPDGGGIAQAFLEKTDIVWEGQGPVPEEWRLASPYSEIKAFRSRCFVIVPLIVRGVAIGVLGADNKASQRPIPIDTIHLLKTFATHAALAIDDARLYEEVTEYRGDAKRKAEDHDTP
jgi:PAS domain S-box-containing protein